jgi:hypothetical protein
MAVVLALPVCLGVSHGLLDFERNQGLEAALIGAAVIYFWTRPKWTEWAAVFSIAALASAAYGYLHHGFGPYVGSGFSAFAAFLGAGSLAVLAVQQIVGGRAPKRKVRETLIRAAVFPYFTFIMAFGVNLTTALRPKVYDLLLYSFDVGLQLRIGPWIGHLFDVSPLLQVAGILVYEYLPVAICLMLALHQAHPERFSVDPMRLFIAVGIVGSLLYNALPACGPVYMFGPKFPHYLPAISDLTIQPVSLAGHPRNAMPSLHFACALLLWWNAAALPRLWRTLAAVFLAMTFLGTIGFGEHYLVDLVVAVPFAMAMQAACLQSASWAWTERRVAFSGAALLTVGSIVALRLGLFQGSFALSWCGVLATLGLSLWWKRALDRRPPRELLEKDVTEVPDDQCGVPVIDPADQVGAVQPHAQAR